MRLDEYQWSRNPRGLHMVARFTKPTFSRYIDMKMGWIKLLALGSEYAGDVAMLNANGITPIIRFYFERPGARPADEGMMQAIAGYIAAGARWFEYYNEPNLDVEWPSGVVPDYSDLNNIIAPLMRNWLDWAERVVRLGGYPAFPSLAETLGGPGSVTQFLDAMLGYLAREAYDRFRALANSGLWVAVHPYYYNHFYQEASGPLDPRGPDQEDGTGAGWHFEYPYDPISQRFDPGRGVLNGTAREPYGDPVGLTGMGTAFMQRFRELFGGKMIPVVGTEGGITPVPAQGSGDSNQPDDRYPAVTETSHAEGTLAAFNWIAQQAPAWMFGLCLWKEDDYFGETGEKSVRNPARAVERLRSTTPLLKTVNKIDALLPGPGPGGLAARIPGPGPIHGQPDLHWIMLDPALDMKQFFDAAKSYWDRFRPVIVPGPELLGEVPNSKSLAITLLAQAANIETLTAMIKARGQNIYVDVIPVESTLQLQGVLSQRVADGTRFG